MTVTRDRDARPQKLGIRRVLRRMLIRAALPADSHFDDAWRMYVYILREFHDTHDIVTILRDLPEIAPEVLAKAEAEHKTYSDALGGAIRVVFNMRCVRPENMRRKMQLAIAENADAKDVASIVGDLEGLEGW
jgi:hypothetical protein